MGVEKDAEESEIKSAFRKLALQWHPDKNAHRLDEATEKFKEIQAAYAVLSDEQERSWYDHHRDDILGGLDGASGGGGVEADLVNINQYYSASCYSTFDDGKDCFFSVYRSVFDRLGNEEAKLSDVEESGPVPDYPSFGTAKSSAADVLAFYDFWGGYSSRMHYAWCDQYNPAEGPNRYVRRAMEKENEGARRAARRQRGEAIRALVAFVKKRDTRWMAAQIEIKRRAAEEEARRKAVEAEAARARVANRQARKDEAAALAEQREREAAETGAYRLADEDSEEEGGRGGKKKGGKKGKAAAAAVKVVVVPAPDEEDEEGVLGEGQQEEQVESEEEEEEVLFCEPCGKEFRTAGAMESHARSKKHREGVAAWEAVWHGPWGVQQQEEEEVEEEEQPVGKAQGQTEEQTAAGSSSTDEAEAEEGSADLQAATASMGGLGLGKAGEAGEATQGAQGQERSSDDSEDDGVPLPPGKGSRGGKVGQGPLSSSEEEGGVGGGKKKPLNKSELRRQAKKVAAEQAKAAGGRSPSTPTASAAPAKDLRKLDAAVLKGGAAGVPHHARMAQANGALAQGLVAGSTSCAVCAAPFDSRNALFAHIKATGHAAVRSEDGSLAAPVAEEKGKGGKGGKKGKGKGKGGRGRGDSDDD